MVDRDDQNLDMIGLTEEAVWQPLRRFLGRDGVRAEQEKDLSWILTPDRDDGYNCVFQVDLDPAEAGPRIDRMVSRYRDQGLHSSWWLGPNTNPPDLGQRLARKGFREVEVLTAMALDMSSDPGPDLPRSDSPGGLEIRRITDPERLLEMMELFGPAVDMTPFQCRQTWESMLDPDGRPDPEYRHFAGLKGGRVVSSVSFFPMGEGVAGVDFVATASDQRSRGFARAVFLTALGAAKAEGFSTAVLQATEMGRPLYSSLGFKGLGRFSIWSDDPGDS